MSSGERPWRLWDADARLDIPHHYYRYKENAQRGAYLYVYDAAVGTKVEVYSISTYVLVGQYIRGVNQVHFYTGKALLEKERNENEIELDAGAFGEVPSDDGGEEGNERRSQANVRRIPSPNGQARG